jgi:hypothetical protein
MGAVARINIANPPPNYIDIFPDFFLTCVKVGVYMKIVGRREERWER